MTDLEHLSAELEALKQRVALLEANASHKPQMVYNWHLRDPQPLVYEHYIDPAMRMTRNGN